MEAQKDTININRDNIVQALFEDNKDLFVTQNYDVFTNQVRNRTLPSIDCTTMNSLLEDIGLSYKTYASHVLQQQDLSRISDELLKEIGYDLEDGKQQIEAFLRDKEKKIYAVIDEKRLFSEAESILFITELQEFYQNISSFISPAYVSEVDNKFSENTRLYHEAELQKGFIFRLRRIWVDLLDALAEDSWQYPEIHQKIHDLKDYVVYKVQEKQLTDIDWFQLQQTLNVDNRLD